MGRFGSAGRKVPTPRSSIVALLSLLPVALLAQPTNAQIVRYRSVVVFGSDPCPAAAANEITVCARQSEAERYRILAPLRHRQAGEAERSWTSRAESLDTVGRRALPDTCSAVGSGGQTGCGRLAWSQWRDARRAQSTDE